MTAGWWYLVSAFLALAAAALVFVILHSSESTTCFRDSIAIRIDGRDDVPKRCDSKPFKAVQAFITEQRAIAAKEDSRPSETDELAARSALIVWMSLFAATAGLAAIVFVQSSAVIWELKSSLSWGLIPRVLVALALAGFPFLLFQLTSYKLSDFDELHRPELRWMPRVIGALMFPAVAALVVIWHDLTNRAGLSLDRVAMLGSRLRKLVSMLGAVLALAVLTTGARWEAIGTLPGGESVPSIVILLWGSTFALGLAAIYVPVHQRWAAEASRLVSKEVCRQLPADPPPGTPGYRAPELALTKELNATLGVGGPLKSLQGSVAVLAPVIAAAVSSLFA